MSRPTYTVEATFTSRDGTVRAFLTGKPLAVECAEPLEVGQRVEVRADGKAWRANG